MTQTACNYKESDTTLRLYAIVRGDLDMPVGKFASQAGHAYLDAFLASQKQNPDIASEYCGNQHGTKVCLVAKNSYDIDRALDQAKDAGIPHALIIDQGHILPPHFDGNPIVTALGIGPATRDQIQHITKRFRLA